MHDLTSNEAANSDDNDGSDGESGGQGLLEVGHCQDEVDQWCAALQCPVHGDVHACTQYLMLYTVPSCYTCHAIYTNQLCMVCRYQD